MLVMSTGIGLCTAPTTSAIMNTAPDDKQGVASAVNDTTREIGRRAGHRAGRLDARGRVHRRARAGLGRLPRSRCASAAADSLGAGPRGGPAHSGPQGAQLADLSKAAFIEAMALVAARPRRRGRRRRAVLDRRSGRPGRDDRATRGSCVAIRVRASRVGTAPDSAPRLAACACCSSTRTPPPR